MPRHPRAAPGGYCYQVINRGNGRRAVFHKDADYAGSVKLFGQAGRWFSRGCSVLKILASPAVPFDFPAHRITCSAI